MVAAGAYSGVQPDLGLKFLKTIDEALDAVIICEQVACEWIVASEHAPDDGVEEEHAQTLERAGASVGFEEEDRGHRGTSQLDLARNSLDVIPLDGGDILRPGKLRRS